MDIWNRIDNPEINCYVYDQLILDTGKKISKCGIFFPINGARSIGCQRERKKNITRRSYKK